MIFVFLCFVISGCFGYRVGTLLPKELKTIHVPVFKNITNEPNLELRATNTVIERLNRDGTLKTVSERDKADSILEATIIKYERKPVRFKGGSTPNEYRLTITVKATFMNLQTSKILWKDKLISGEAEFVVLGSLPSSESAALPAAFEDLAKDIVEAIVEGWQ